MAESSPLAHSPTLVQGTGPEGPARADTDDELQPGAAVGEYVVDKFLGAGAMGEVYAGIQPVIGKKVAIKVLKKEVGATTDGAERFKREARAVNQIDHPHVIDVFSFGRLADGRLYLVMDLVEGRSLRKAITAGPLPLAVALDVLAQIADALDAAHQKNVIHRDLKPDNVMLGGDLDAPNVFVLDFGLAKLLTPDGADAKASMLTGQGTWLGTPGYMAPEQWSADGAGPASDRYSLGVMAFELLSGSLPFQAQSLPQMMEQHFRAKVPALSAKGATVPTAFDPIVARAMAKDPAARFASAGEMVEALRAAAGARGRRATTPTKRPWLPAVLGIGVLGLSVGAVLAMRGGSDDDSRRDAPAVAPSPPITAGSVRIDIDSVPRGATVTRGSVTASATTPTYLEAKDGESIAFDVMKPGYQTVHHEIVAHAGLALTPFPLVEVTGYEGVWMLKDGGLRAFRRDGDRVTASKLSSVGGEREFFRQYALVLAPTGVTFTATENIHEPGRPEHPSCYFPYTTEYHYEPTSDVLSVRRQHIVSDVIDGACVRKSSTMTPPEPLARADRHSSTERDSLAPVGRPDLGKQTFDKPITNNIKKQPPSKKAMFDEIDAKQKAVKSVAPAPEQLSKVPSNESKQPPPNVPAQNATPQEILPQNAEPPAPQQAQPRGDSQVAPPVQQQLKKKK